MQAHGTKSRPKVATTAAEGAIGASVNGATIAASYRERLPTYTEVVGFESNHAEDINSAPAPPPYHKDAVGSQNSTGSIEQAGPRPLLSGGGSPGEWQAGLRQAQASPTADSGGGHSWAERVTRVVTDPAKAVHRYISPEQRERELIQRDPKAFVDWVRCYRNKPSRVISCYRCR